MLLSNLISSNARVLKPANIQANCPGFAAFTEVVVAPLGVIQRLFGSLIGSISKADAIGVFGLTGTLIALIAAGRTNRFLVLVSYKSVVLGSATCVVIV
jgi:hypothetical protein